MEARIHDWLSGYRVLCFTNNIHAEMKAKETILRKRLVSEGHLPNEAGPFETNRGKQSFLLKSNVFWLEHTEWWYEEVSAHVLSDEGIKAMLLDFAKFCDKCLTEDAQNFLLSDEDFIDLYLTTKQDDPVR